MTSPVLAPHNYLVNLAIGINNIPPGAMAPVQPDNIGLAGRVRIGRGAGVGG